MAKLSQDETEQGDEVKIKHLKARPSKLRKIKTPERDMALKTPERDRNLSER